ncbi:flagellar hook protein FlgE [Desulfurivibrio alkaliphilus]|uniref:Flagellar hook protein FlgE n=1 Tax=Desulfurivibrio alkaliphilus (strain DSM 19089 / UNIQEM U267 / AHT2) TaxID=589865 RepID=D6Z0I2_DESAT|nr:flagellar hook-basal body complex protein [Desulfurivibrio alkaliphilus]ADH85211.1 fagellar hook-basal body protein [Desulfurivibrio alkaliphilus AHT 2]
MSLHNMMFNGMSGINSMAGNMAVLGDNVANINTVSYKNSQTTFQNVLTSSQDRFHEVGNGSQIQAISKNFRPGPLEQTTKATDMAIGGKGFFMVNDYNGETLYTRDGQFDLKVEDYTPAGFYNLVTPAGYRVQGLNLDYGNGNGQPGDILVRRDSLPQATENVTLALNLQSSAAPPTDTTSLYESWNGAATPPLAAGAYDYQTSIEAYDDQGQSFPLNIFFDHTDNPQEREFLITHDPALDRRLMPDGSRYNSGPEPEKGAGALLYGKLIFSSVGELMDIQAWAVPPDGNLELWLPADGDDGEETGTGELLPSEYWQQPDAGSGLFSFDYNISGTGDNLSSTIDFGTTLSRQVATSSGMLKADGSGAAAPGAHVLTTWNQVYDSNGQQVQEGDTFIFQGLNHQGEEVTSTYVVDYGERVEDLMLQLEADFNVTALLRNGRLELQANDPGESQMAITSVTYLDAAGNSPADNPDLAQPFGEQGAEFALELGQDMELSPLRTTNYATSSSTIFQDQDGYGAGVLQNVSVKPDGTIVGNYSNGQSHDQAQVMLADFANYHGLIPGSNNTYQASAQSGDPVIGTPGSGVFGQVLGSSLEGSNVDLARQFADLTMTQRIFQANSKSITTADEIHQTLMRLK